MQIVGCSFPAKNLREGEVLSSLSNAVKNGKDQPLVIFGFSWGIPFSEEGDIAEKLEKAVENSSKVIFISSSAVYSRKVFSPYCENDTKHYPKDLFGIADTGVEEVLTDLCFDKKKCLVILRPDLIIDDQYIDILYAKQRAGKLEGSPFETVCPIPLDYLWKIIRKVAGDFIPSSYVYNIGGSNIDTFSLYRSLGLNPKMNFYFSNKALDCSTAKIDGLIDG